MKKKQLLSALLAGSLSLSVAAPALAAEAETAPESYEVVTENGQQYVPLRSIAEDMGFTVTWDGEDQMVTLDSGTMHANFTIGVNSYIAATSIEGMVGMTAPFTLSSAPVVSDGVTYVPLELFTVLMGNHADGLTVTDGTVDLRTEF